MSLCSRLNSDTVLISIVLLFFLTMNLSAQVPGKDGSLTVSSSSQIVNLYKTVTTDISAPESVIDVNNTTGISAGDYIMIYQAKGANLRRRSNARFGEIRKYNSAGLYELRGVQSVTANTVTVNAPLLNDYEVVGEVQLIRIPQYTSLTIALGGSITAQAWNGMTGGIAALHVQGTMTVSGSVDVSEKGFRGGMLSSNSGQTQQGDSEYFYTTPDSGAFKGEGIADSTKIGNRLYGRGPAINGGGGGNRHNAGGGGGANGDNSNSYSGHGVMCTSCTGASAWGHDPNGPGANSSGGGRGGYTYSSSQQNALTTAPGNSGWGGDHREDVGGWGGRPLSNDPATRIFMGGGGGAGHQNNNAGGAGGNGGGIIFVQANIISGSGSLLANGESGGDTRGGGNDAPGGGGAGGTIIAQAFTSLAGIALEADGGNGGNQNIGSSYGNEAEGPGGGGGGGYIATVNGTGSSQSADGGANGVTNSPALTEFPANGATFGADGQTFETITLLPLPVELESFSAYRLADRVTLHWQTATELNNYGFAIEYNTDAAAWKEIGFVQGQGTISTPSAYKYTHVLPQTIRLASVLSYRLRQIDRDGTIQYSPVVQLFDEMSSPSLAILSTYPNPASSSLVASVFLPRSSVTTVRLVNMLGQVVHDATKQRPAGVHAFPIPVGGLPNGPYLLQVLTGDMQTMQRISVVH